MQEFIKSNTWPTGAEGWTRFYSHSGSHQKLIHLR